MIMDSVNKIINSIKDFVRNFKFTEEVYVESNKGEKVIIDSTAFENANKKLTELQKAIDSLATIAIKGEDNILDGIEKMKKALSTGNPEIIATVTAIFEKGLKEIDELGILNVSPFKTPEELKADKIARGEAKEDGKTPHGGDITIISAKGYENQPKTEKKDNSEKKIGAGIVSGKNKEFQNELEGEHIKKDKALEIIGEIIKQTTLVIEKIENGKGLDTQSIEEQIKNNKEKIAEILAQSSQNKPEKIKGKTVINAKRLTSRALALLMAAGITVATIFGYSLDRNGNYSIAIEQQEKRLTGDDTKELEKEARKSIEQKSIHEQGANKEEIDNGSLRKQDEELLTRKSETDTYKELDETLQEIEDIKQKYGQKTNPTNLEKLEYQEDLLEKQIEIIDIIIEAKQGDNKALDKWIRENNEHINKMKTQKDINEHKLQNANNKSLKVQNNEAITEWLELKEQKENKMELLDKIELLSDMDKIQDIEHFSESIYDFYDENKDNISLDQLTQFLSKNGINLDLFAAYTNSDVGKNDLENFFSNFYILQNTYDLYVENYCQGDYGKADSGTYVNYFNVAQEEYMKELGDTEDGIIGRFWQKLDQNKMNKRFYEQTTDKEQNFIENFVQFAKTIIDVSRDRDLKETLKTIDELQNNEITNEETKETETNKEISLGE